MTTDTDTYTYRPTVDMAGPAPEVEAWPTQWASLATAEGMVSDDASAAVLRCSCCLMECDTYKGAHDSPAWSLYRFLEHCAFEHGGPADILVTQVVRIIKWER